MNLQEIINEYITETLTGTAHEKFSALPLVDQVALLTEFALLKGDTEMAFLLIASYALGDET